MARTLAATVIMVVMVVLVAACGQAFLTVPTATGGSAPTLPAAEAKPALTVVVAPGTPQRERVRAALERSLRPSFDLRFADLPSAPRAPSDAAVVELDLAAARKAYIDAEFAPCVARLGDPTRLTDLLADGKRLLAERMLFWRIACRVGAGNAADARSDAEAFAVFDLEAPPDVESAAPEVEALLAATAQHVADAPRVPLAVRFDAEPGATFRVAARAVVALDGRAAVCTAPCTVDVHPGDHVVRVDADGFAPEIHRVRAAAPSAELAVHLNPAAPEVAAAQWTSRYADSPSVDSAVSVGLLAVATRSRSLAVVAAEPTPKGSRLFGVLALDGGVAARSERSAARDEDLPDVAPALVRDLLLRGQLIPETPLYKRPLFWVAVGAAAALATTLTILLVYQPAKQVQVTL
jgi:PEGA domain